MTGVVLFDCILAEPSSPESVAAISAILLAAHKRLAHSDMPAHYHYAWPHGETCTNPTPGEIVATQVRAVNEARFRAEIIDARHDYLDGA